MKLSKEQIINVGAALLDDAKKLYTALESGMAALNAHNGTAGTQHVNAGPTSVALSYQQQVIDQLEKHVAENSAQPAPADAKPPTPPGA